VDDRVPYEIDPMTPNVARMYDYYLGGKDNYEVDRAAAEKIFRIAPFTSVLARANRGFLTRATRCLAASGIRQFLDIGTGLPTQGNVHEVARSLIPDSRVVYLDNDPVVVVHGQALIGTDDATVVLQHDLKDPETILGDPMIRDVIDFDEPVGLLLVSVLHCLRDDEGVDESVAALRDALAPGSHIVISHITGDDEVTQNAQAIYSKASTGMTHRTRERLLDFFGGYTLLEPGLVRLDEWQPDAKTETITAGGGYYLCGVGRKDGR
jgi:hypothetical protein